MTTHWPDSLFKPVIIHVQWRFVRVFIVSSRRQTTQKRPVGWESIATDIYTSWIDRQRALRILFLRRTGRFELQFQTSCMRPVVVAVYSQIVLSSRGRNAESLLRMLHIQGWHFNTTGYAPWVHTADRRKQPGRPIVYEAPLVNQAHALLRSLPPTAHHSLPQLRRGVSALRRRHPRLPRLMQCIRRPVRMLSQCEWATLRPGA